jgi:ERCC4-related helicase
MTYAKFAEADIRLENDRISTEDADRQKRAAIEVLTRLRRQPGVILADEVGMGKTFVALAVAVSILLESSDDRPVVVMYPPSLREKWPKDWDTFKSKCLPDLLRGRFRAATANSGIEFLKLLDAPPERRTHVIFLAHGAIHRAIGDGFAKLAVIKRAFKGRSSLRAQRLSFSRFAGKLLWLDWVERRSPGVLGTLLDRPYEVWLKVLHRDDQFLKERITEDPVPQQLADVLNSMESTEFEDLVESLRQLPQRESPNLEDRLKEARQGIAAAMEHVWKLALTRADFRSPLLVLDEAHHVKNPATRLASLFATEDSVKDSEFFKSAGPLGGKFDRMLFLTATPFQLGHGELIRVLDRFEGIAWTGSTPPSMTRDQFKIELGQLGRVLDDAQASALRLDGTWGRLETQHLESPDGIVMNLDEWWEGAQNAEGEGLVAQVAEQVRRTRHAMENAETALSPWVLRHLKLSNLPNRQDVPRRVTLAGAAISDNGDPSCGLEISGQVLLPFLLAGRAQGLVAASARGRALFAEGLASSFEAYLETRNGRQETDEDSDLSNGAAPPPDLEWYLRHLDLALPRSSQNVRSAHPKIRATAERAVALWRAGEKVLVFCHYRATGRALRQHISALLNDEIGHLGQAKMPGLSLDEVHRALEDLGERFFKDDDLRVLVSSWIDAIVIQFPMLISNQRDKIVDVVRRFLRTPSFIARYLPLHGNDLSAAAFASAFDAADEGQQSLRQKIEHFCRFLAERCTALEREGFLTALETIQTGSHFGREVRSVFDPAENRGISDAAGAVLLPNVRLANGEVRQETRQRLLLTFNTPLFPEVLIASSVLAEGVDLHLNCRHVIHHDLCWNPSILEQRSGRVDRIGCQAERVGKSIHVFLPYLAATQDEKMFRVVRDRERWFQIIMGENYEVDEAATDRRAERIPLPLQLQRELSMHLHPRNPE